jgi:hypothetical protein
MYALMQRSSGTLHHALELRHHLAMASHLEDVVQCPHLPTRGWHGYSMGEYLDTVCGSILPNTVLALHLYCMDGYVGRY